MKERDSKGLEPCSVGMVFFSSFADWSNYHLDDKKLVLTARQGA